MAQLKTNIKNSIHQVKRNLFVLFIGVSFIMGSCTRSSTEPWELIFNGQNLDGWKVVGNTGIVQVVDSMIICNQIPTYQSPYFCLQQ